MKEKCDKNVKTILQVLNFVTPRNPQVFEITSYSGLEEVVEKGNFIGHEPYTLDIEKERKGKLEDPMGQA